MADKLIVKREIGTKILPETWEKVRSWYHFPSLREPTVAPEVEGGAYFDFLKREIVVGNDLVETLNKAVKLPKEECLEGVLSHEVGHYMIFPRTMGTIILAGKMIDDFFDTMPKEDRGFIFQTYADMADDTASVLVEQRRDSVLKVREALQETMTDPLNRNVREVMLAYLHFQAGKKPELDKELEKYLEQMKEIDFLSDNTEKMRQGLFKFGTIIKEMTEKYAGKGGKGSGYTLVPMGPGDMDAKEILKNVPKKVLRDAMREISGKITKGEYEKVKKWLKENGADPVEPQQSQLSIGTSGGELPVDQGVLDYYKGLSSLYPIVVGRKLLKTETTKKSWDQIEKWRAGSEPLLALPGSSGGKFMPGITKKIRIHPHPIMSKDYKIPHVLIAIDSSGSMPCPKDVKSYAVLAAYCAARSYHLHGAYVGVINFSGESFYLPYTRELDHALGAISAYQGGGTEVDMAMLKRMLSKDQFEMYQRNPGMDMRHLPREAMKKNISLEMAQLERAFEEGCMDLIMFTDGGIANLGEAAEFFAEREELNRATIVLTSGFEQEIESINGKVKVHRVESEKDIPDLVIKSVQDNFNRFSDVMMEGKL